MTSARPTDPIRAPDLPEAILRRQNHIEWIESFAVSLQLGRERRGAPVTPVLQGAVTRLQWAAQDITLLKADIERLTARSAALEALLAQHGIHDESPAGAKQEEQKSV